jgi:hypothetical protein
MTINSRSRGDQPNGNPLAAVSGAEEGGLMSWNYRLVKYTNGDESWLKIHEVHYNPDGSIWGMDNKEDAIFAGADLDEAKAELALLLKATEKPILNDGEIVFVDMADLDGLLTEAS